MEWGERSGIKRSGVEWEEWRKGMVELDLGKKAFLLV